MYRVKELREIMSNWNLEGLMVEGSYLDGEFPISGRVELSRVKFGGSVCHTVSLDYPIEVYGAVRDRVIIEHRDVVRVFEV
jgi:hypothetical protein